MVTGREQVWMDGYVRVSRVGRRRGERFISPSEQGDTIEGWARAHGVEVLEVFREFDESGGRDDRPLLEKAVERVESGISQGVVVSEADRFGRSLLSGLAAIQRIKVAGGRFVAVKNGLDTSTDTGRLVLRILLSMAEWDSDRIREKWEAARTRAVARGVYPHNGAPIGYRRTRSGRLRPDPETAAVVAEVFRRRAEGDSLASLQRWLEALGIPTARGNPGWTTTTMQCVVRNRAYLGEVRHRWHVNERAHPPLVDAATWQAAQAPERVSVRHDRATRMLSRLVHCAACSMTMTAQWHRRRHGRWDVIYICHGHSASGPCPAPASISAPYLDAYIEECFFELLARRRAEPAADLAAAEHALRSASAALVRYRDGDHVLRTLGEEAYLAGVAVRDQRVRRARLKLAAVRESHFIYTLPPNSKLERRWVDMSDHERRSLIAKAIDCVFVSAGHRPLEDRVTICRTGTAPKLPRPGTFKARQARPFVAQPKHRWPTPKPWPTDRIERELNDYLQGKRIWPSPEEFEAAGRRRLHEQIVRHAGVKCWAHHVALPVIGRGPSREPWTEARVRAALRLYLRRKRHWPSQHDFERDGLSGLHHAIRHTRGISPWRDEFALPTAPPRGGTPKAKPRRA